MTGRPRCRNAGLDPSALRRGQPKVCCSTASRISARRAAKLGRDDLAGAGSLLYDKKRTDVADGRRGRGWDTTGVNAAELMAHTIVLSPLISKMRPKERCRRRSAELTRLSDT